MLEGQISFSDNPSEGVVEHSSSGTDLVCEKSGRRSRCALGSASHRPWWKHPSAVKVGETIFGSSKTVGSAGQDKVKGGNRTDRQPLAGCRTGLLAMATRKSRGERKPGKKVESVKGEGLRGNGEAVAELTGSPGESKGRAARAVDAGAENVSCVR